MASTALSAAPTDKELIVLILIDAVRADSIGAYGYPKNTSPVIDALAAEGTRYETVYSNAPWTRPSTASYLTGIHGSRHRTESAKTKLPKDVKTIAQRLRKAGWQTTGFSANGNGGSMAGLHKGFHHFEDPTNTYQRSKLKKRCGKLYHQETTEPILKDCMRYNRLPTGEFLVDTTLKYLRKSTADKEFLFIFLVDPHDPYFAPTHLEAEFLGKEFAGKYNGKIRRHALWETNNNYPENERRSMKAIYDAGIRYADEAVGTFMQGLKEMGRDKNTTVFITSDHGEGFGEHNFYLHAHHFWDEVIKIPLVVHGPQFPKKVESRLTDSLDVAKTIVEMAKANTKGMEGHSLLKAPPANKYVISEYNEFGIHRQAITDGRYKVIWQRPADEAVYMKVAKKKEYFPSVSFDKEVIHVFDLSTDPKEKKDLSKAMPTKAAELLQILRDYVAKSIKLAER